MVWCREYGDTNRFVGQVISISPLSFLVNPYYTQVADFPKTEKSKTWRIDIISKLLYKCRNLSLQHGTLTLIFAQSVFCFVSDADIASLEIADNRHNIQN